MRQTLWAEQMVLSNNTESVKADSYIHLHVIPTANEKLLQKTYKSSSKNMETSWRESINNQDKYKIIDNKLMHILGCNCCLWGKDQFITC
jgi:hypothetical protein